MLCTLASPGTCISLRVPADQSFSLEDCVASGSVTPGAAQLLARMIEAKLPFLISGGTGRGKTTCDYDTPSRRESDACRRFDPCLNTRPDRRITLAALTQSVRLDLASEMTPYLSQSIEGCIESGEQPLSAWLVEDIHCANPVDLAADLSRTNPRPARHREKSTPRDPT